MTNITEEKILKLLETVIERLDNQSADISHMSTTIEALAEGQKDIRETMATKQDLEVVENRLDNKINTVKEELEMTIEAAKTEIQATILNQVTKLVRILDKYKTRLEHLEKHTGTTDPTQN